LPLVSGVGACAASGQLDAMQQNNMAFAILVIV
jgi:hypothetical protein